MIKKNIKLRFRACLLGMLLAGAALFISACTNSTATMGAPAAQDQSPAAPEASASPDSSASGVFGDGIVISDVDVSAMTAQSAKQAVLASLSEKISGISYTLKAQDYSATITADDLSIEIELDSVLERALSLGEGELPSESELEANLFVDEAQLMRRLDAIAAEFDVAAEEPKAEARLGEDNKPEFIYFDGVEGRQMDKAAVAKNIVALIQAHIFESEFKIDYAATPAKTTIDGLKENTKFRAKYTTRYKTSTSDSVTKNRVFNVDKGAGLLNACMLPPGEEFSFNGHVGLRTEKDGWKLANGISGGKEYTLQAGGGICQVSTTLYNAALSANLDVTYRKAHSIPSDYVPKGLDATVDSSGIDLTFINNTNYPIYIFAYTHKDPSSSRYLRITVELYGEPLPEGTEYKPRSEILEETPRNDTVYKEDPNIPIGYQVTTVIRHDGYVANAYLDEYKNGELVRSIDLGKSRYRGNPDEISIGTGDPAVVPVPSGAKPATGSIPTELDVAGIVSNVAEPTQPPVTTPEPTQPPENNPDEPFLKPIF